MWKSANVFYQHCYSFPNLITLSLILFSFSSQFLSLCFHTLIDSTFLNFIPCIFFPFFNFHLFPSHWTFFFVSHCSSYTNKHWINISIIIRLKRTGLDDCRGMCLFISFPFLLLTLDSFFFNFPLASTSCVVFPYLFLYFLRRIGHSAWRLYPKT